MLFSENRSLEIASRIFHEIHEFILMSFFLRFSCQKMEIFRKYKIRNFSEFRLIYSSQNFTWVYLLFFQKYKMKPEAIFKPFLTYCNVSNIMVG